MKRRMVDGQLPAARQDMYESGALRMIVRLCDGKVIKLVWAVLSSFSTGAAVWYSRAGDKSRVEDPCTPCQMAASDGDEAVQRTYPWDVDAGACRAGRRRRVKQRATG